MFLVLSLVGLASDVGTTVESLLNVFKCAKHSVPATHGDHGGLSLSYSGVRQESAPSIPNDDIQVVTGFSSRGLGANKAVGEAIPTKDVTALGDDNAIYDSSISTAKIETKCDAPGLYERAPWDKSLYKQSANKGKILLCYLDNPASAKSKAGTQWTEYSQLSQWGWTFERYIGGWNHIRASVSTLQSSSTMSQLQTLIREKMGDSEFARESLENGINMIWGQFDEVEVDGVIYPATNAEYNNVYWPENGIIFANNNHGPEARIKEGAASENPWKDNKGKPLPIVELKQWSDVSFLTWKSLTTQSQRAKLKWVFRRVITNAMTLEIISDVMSKRGFEGRQDEVEGGKATKAPLWPGLLVKAGEEGFDALVGSPNSLGLCWMLIQ